MSLSNQLKTFIEMLAVAIAFGSAAFWYEAASINPPWAAMQLRRQGKLNARATLLSGISALLLWIALAVWPQCRAFEAHGLAATG